MRRLTTAWDQWFLMHSPLLWQLRLHWYLPLALLWCLLMFGGWIGWTAEPARWMGSPEGTVVATWNRPEDTTRQVGGIIAWIIAFGLALWWLASHLELATQVLAAGQQGLPVGVGQPVVAPGARDDHAAGDGAGGTAHFPPPR